jgi:hypothetical protein
MIVHMQHPKNDLLTLCGRDIITVTKYGVNRKACFKIGTCGVDMCKQCAEIYIKRYNAPKEWSRCHTGKPLQR